MARYLVVAHETVGNPKLVDKLQEIAKDDKDAEFVLLVPATPVRHLLLWKDDTATEREAAERRLAEGREAITRSGLRLVSASIGAESPVDAIEEELRQNPEYVGVVISTLPKEHSRWLRLNLPQMVEEKYGLPVHHVELTPSQLRYWLPTDRA
jgi:hypothetical protein